MKTIIKVKINAEGLTAKEVNPWGEERPVLGKYERKGYENSTLNSKVKIWEAAESKLRTFKIAGVRPDWRKENDEIIYTAYTYHGTCSFKIGSIYQAEVINKTLVRIFNSK